MWVSGVGIGVLSLTAVGNMSVLGIGGYVGYVAAAARIVDDDAERVWTCSCHRTDATDFEQQHND